MDRMDDAKETIFFAHSYMSELGRTIDRLNQTRMSDKKVIEYMQTFFLVGVEQSDIQRKNNGKLLEDLKRRYFDAPDLQHVGKNAYRSMLCLILPIMQSRSDAPKIMERIYLLRQ